VNPASIFHTASSVLVIKLRAIGDVLLSTPVVENLAREFPHLSIDFLCEKFASDVVRGNPHINAVLAFDKKKDASLDLIRKIRSRKYNIVIDLFGNPRTALVTRLSGAKHRIGFPFRGRAYAYNHCVTPRGGEVHNIEFNLDVLRAFSIPIPSHDPLFPLDQQSEIFAQRWLSSEGLNGKKIIGINPSGGWNTKRWDLGSYAHLIRELYGRYHFPMLLFWGPGEENDVLSIQNMTGVPVTKIPKTSLKEMGALLKHCSYLISNDSGPMHIAASLGVPTLGIYGPTDPLLQGPFGEKNLWVRHDELDCLTCNLTECPIGNICMKDLPVSVVMDAFERLVAKNT
jgi:ADP-heptose:LPS heptosyltransferase